MESITSRSNPLCAHLRKLAASASHRRESGEFLCDSPKLLEEVLLWRRELLKTVLCTDPGKLPELPERTRVVVVPESLMEYLSPARTPQGVISLCRKPEEALPETLPGRRYALLDGVQDPGNVGTILRTADPAGYKLAILMKGTADVYAPKVVRAATGSLFRMPVVFMDSNSELVEFSRAAGKKLVATCFDTKRYYFDEDLTKDIALIIGNEGNGISEELMESSDLKIKIPMQGNIESLNASVAAGILMYEAVRGKKG